MVLRTLLALVTLAAFLNVAWSEVSNVSAALARIGSSSTSAVHEIMAPSYNRTCYLNRPSLKFSHKKGAFRLPFLTVRHKSAYYSLPSAGAAGFSIRSLMLKRIRF